MKSKIFFILVSFIFLLNFVSSAHYITGYVVDAKDGEPANSKTIILWNPLVGIEDNLTDIVGINGNSGVSNVYMIDCEALNLACVYGDILSLKIINNGDEYVSDIVNVTVSNEVYDVVENISLNSPPVATIIFPNDASFTKNSLVSFNCSYYDADGDSGFISLYDNSTGLFIENNITSIISGSSVNILRTFNEGVYSFGCLAKDNLSKRFSENRTFIVDLTRPKINSIEFNESYGCINSSLKVFCNTSDFYGVENVTIQVSFDSYSENKSATLNSGLYTSDFYLLSGNWSVTCYSFDKANNSNSSVEFFKVFSGNPELKINYSSISFSNDFPMENENLTINLLVYNEGCVDSTDFEVELYRENRSIGEFIGSSLIKLNKFSSKIISFYFPVEIGKTNFFSYVDYVNSQFEDDESNNLANKTVEVLSWQNFYGNISAVKILSGSFSGFENWENQSNLEGNVFMVDSESQIDWLNLYSIGKKKDGSFSNQDYFEIDSILGTSDFSDSVSQVYSSSGFSDFIIHKKNVTSVPVINSTINSNFETGILWDGSDDTDGEYSLSDKEDIIFVSKISKGSEGKYGIYDYEINVPAKLREYHLDDTEEIYFYYDLI